MLYSLEYSLGRDIIILISRSILQINYRKYSFYSCLPISNRFLFIQNSALLHNSTYLAGVNKQVICDRLAFL
jgi:hypothetical protein